MMIKNTDINERILYIIENQYNGNQKKFAEHIGFSAQVVFNIVSGRKTKPSYDVIFAIISTNDDINSEWLITGNGNFKKKTISDQKDDYIIELQKDKIENLEKEIKRLKKANKTSTGYMYVAEPPEKLIKEEEEND